MKTTLSQFGRILEEADFPDLFDAQVDGEIIDTETMTGSVADSSGDRVIEFKVIEMNEDETEIIIDFDDEKYKMELTHPFLYFEILETPINETLKSICHIDFSTFCKAFKNPKDFVVIDGELFERV